MRNPPPSTPTMSVLFRNLLIRVFAALIGAGVSFHAYAFLYPVAVTTPFIEGGSGELHITTRVGKREIVGEDGDRKVPYNSIMQPAHWLASDPSRIYAATPVGNCTWYCVASTRNDSIADLAERWSYLSWSGKVLIPGAAGSKVCSGVIIRTDRDEGLVTSPFYVGPNFDGNCGYVYSNCIMEMQGAAELIHGEIFDTDADGHSASTQLKIRCYGTTYVRMRLVSGSGAGDEDRVTLSNGGKSRLFVNDNPISSQLRLQDGINTVKLSDKLEIPADVTLGKFTGSAVLMVEPY
ncbi:hypothetical protein [Achromobacter marplatensis]|uniref:Uncharacterized protein n=1 Tax=Achromobacter marplatensis TaxID=470868 RepID=A0AA42WGM9_9BURK|nr:hypothetical protein [Achromobacter marplatensis]MDH2053259.1 hypothetical protein [Achromobacter marplatensis]